MVKLENPYEKQISLLQLSIHVCILFILGYLCFRLHIFSFLYQYSISMLILILTAYLFDRGLVSRDRVFKTDFITLRWVPLIISAAVVFFILYYITKTLKDITLIGDLFKKGGDISRIEFLVFMIFVIPTIDEIFFRGYLQYNLMNRIGIKAAYIVASLIYTLYFIFTQNIWTMLFFLILGFYMGYIFLKNKSIILNITLHALFMLLIFIYPF
jgi:membrane protease YdiL (CAAX protease family)